MAWVCRSCFYFSPRHDGNFVTPPEDAWCEAHGLWLASHLCHSWAGKGSVEGYFQKVPTLNALPYRRSFPTHEGSLCQPWVRRLQPQHAFSRALCRRMKAALRVQGGQHA
jgi:hypothetical protein